MLLIIWLNVFFDNGNMGTHTYIQVSIKCDYTDKIDKKHSEKKYVFSKCFKWVTPYILLFKDYKVVFFLSIIN